MANLRSEELTDEQWELSSVLIPEPVRRPDGRGRPWRGNREVMNGVLWILRSGARWQDLPERFPPYQTCHRRYQQWVRAGVLRDVLETLAQDLQERGELDLSECFIDGTFIVAKKGVETLARPSGAKARSSWWAPFGQSRPAQRAPAGFPLALYTTCASPHEVTLVLDTLEQSLVEPKPQHLIGDKAYDSDRLNEQLAAQNIEMIAPHRKNHKPENKTQVGRSLRRYKRR